MVIKKTKQKENYISKSVGKYLNFFVKKFNNDPSLQDQLKSKFGWINASIGYISDDGMVEKAIIIKDGILSVEDQIPENCDFKVIFADHNYILDAISAGFEHTFHLIFNGAIRFEGNVCLYGFWEYLGSLVLGEQQQKDIEAEIEEHKKLNREIGKNVDISGRQARKERKMQRLHGKKVDLGVKYLDDPYLSKYSLEDFPRLKKFREDFFKTKLVVSPEYGKLITDFFVDDGYDVNKEGLPWNSSLDRARCFQYLMKNKKPVIRKNDLLAGSYTPDPIRGMVCHPQSVAPYLWGELKSCDKRELFPYEISEDTIETFHKYIFPFWVKKTIEHTWNIEFDDSLPLEIHQRFFAIFYWKIVSIMEITPSYETLLIKGLNGIRDEINLKLEKDPDIDDQQKSTLKAMKIALNGVAEYSHNLALLALELSQREDDLKRKNEIIKMHKILLKVPNQPADSLEEAIQSIIIMHIVLGLENFDDGPSFGRLDQILQPYFERDMQKLKTEEEKENYLHHVIELLGCLFMKEASHEIIQPDFSNYQNSGSPPNATITVGGVTPNGKDAVNDMSYILLKLTEILTLNNPNVHARYKTGINSREFLKRVCEVNFITGSTPAIHGDDAIITALASHGWSLEDVRNWNATGCVEPSLMGKHCSATSSLEINLVAPLEMAFNNGRHPRMNWNVGPKTGVIEDNDFTSFEDFWHAFKTQVEFLLEQSVIGNNQLGLIYQKHLAAPLLSSLIEGCIKNASGVNFGGAKYNSSGATMIGLTDVVDSLMVIKKLVYDNKIVSFTELKRAFDNNFIGYDKILALIKSKVSKFGSGDEEALAIANRVTKMVNTYYRNKENHRGGNYRTGWWSMANHTFYGRVTAALPSGRMEGEPFTPGLTPHPSASTNLLDNLLDVAKLDPKTLDNNIAFNVRITPSQKNSYEETITHMVDYVTTFFESGGMQVQFNVVNTDTLKDAMANPEFYPDLMVRISGYCAFFTKIQRDLQLEVIRRCEYEI